MRLHSPATRTHSVVKELIRVIFSLVQKLEAYFPKGPELKALRRASFLFISVELMGIEPTTPGLQSRCSPS